MNVDLGGCDRGGTGELPPKERIFVTIFHNTNHFYAYIETEKCNIIYTTFYILPSITLTLPYKDWY